MGHMMRAHAIMPMWNPGIGLKKASRGELDACDCIEVMKIGGSSTDRKLLMSSPGCVAISPGALHPLRM